MINVTLVGKGNISWHLKKVLSQTDGVQVHAVLSSRGNTISETLNSVAADTDIYILAVSDDAIASVSALFKGISKLVVHTSGSVSIHALPKGLKRGVFYPLQTFSKGNAVNFKTVPICIEAENEKDIILLKKLANLISDTVYEITSEQRKSLHLAAVFVNNFVNHLYHIGDELCEQHQVPFAILRPLIAETAKKITHLPPLKAQTGPAKRQDLQTIQTQSTLLKNDEHQKIYNVLTQSILNTYGKKL